MKSLMSAALLLIFSTAFYAQEVSIKTEKKEYKIDEIITLIYEVKAKVDSQTALNGTNFTLVDGPKNRQSTTNKGTETTITFTSTYRVKANAPGTVEVFSPTFNFNNLQKKAENLVVKVSDKKLTEIEKDEINFNEFKDNSAKLKGTMRFVLSDNFGYIEKFNGSQWEFHRRLSKDEVDNLAKK